MADVRPLFDACAEKYPVMIDYLEPSTSIVSAPTFKATVVKIPNDPLLSTSEQRAIDRFVLPTSQEISAPRVPKSTSPQVFFGRQSCSDIRSVLRSSTTPATSRTSN